MVGTEWSCASQAPSTTAMDALLLGAFQDFDETTCVCLLDSKNTNACKLTSPTECLPSSSGPTPDRDSTWLPRPCTGDFGPPRQHALGAGSNPSFHEGVTGNTVTFLPHDITKAPSSVGSTIINHPFDNSRVVAASSCPEVIRLGRHPAVPLPRAEHNELPLEIQSNCTVSLSLVHPTLPLPNAHASKLGAGPMYGRTCGVLVAHALFLDFIIGSRSRTI